MVQPDWTHKRLDRISKQLERIIKILENLDRKG